MPYTKPPDKIKGLPKHAQEVWMAAFNAAWKQYDGDEAKANATAWAAVKKAGYYQDPKGKWRKKETTEVEGMDSLSAFVPLDSRGNVWNDLPGWAPGGSAPPEWIRVLPLGKVLLNDSRDPFYVTPESIKKVMDKFRSNQVDMVIDYEHQTMSGDQAPAAGWVKELRERDDGLWAYVEWTPKAKDLITNKEYRYYSPTVRLDSSRHVQELLHIGLTNFPAIKGIPPLVLKGEVEMNDDGGKTMIEQLVSILELGKDSTEVDVLMAVRDLLDVKKICDSRMAELQEATSRIEKLSAELTDAELRAAKAENTLNRLAVPLTVTEVLGIKKDASLTEVISRIDGLKLAAERANELEQELANFKGSLVKTQAEQLVEEALRTGRTSPAELEKANGKLKKLAETDPEFFKEFVLGRPAGSVVPLDRLPKSSQEKPGNEVNITDNVLTILKHAGISLEQYKEQLERERRGETFVGF